MSERKVLNKYYPPDFDPSKIPKLKLPRNRQYSIRIMAPFNMRCNMCGEYIYKGKKFNSRKETVEDEDYLGLRIFRFYIKCPRCVSEIAFKTDLRTTDYALEDGATRNFEASKTAEEMAIREKQAKEDEELNNPMKVLENRTKASRMEMEQIDALEELKEMNSRLANVDHESMLQMHNTYSEQLLKLQEEQDEKFIKSVFGEKGEAVVKRLQDSDSEDESDKPPLKKLTVTGGLSIGKPTDLLTEDATRSFAGTSDVQNVPKRSQKSTKKPAVWEKSIGMLSSKYGLAGLVRKKTTATSAVKLDSKSPQDKLSCEANNTISTSAVKLNNTDAEPKEFVDGPVVSNSKGSVVAAPTVSALGMLGDYSDSEEDSDT